MLSNVVAFIVVIGLFAAWCWYQFSEGGHKIKTEIYQARHAAPTVICPSCHRPGVGEKVTGGKRLVSAAAGGLLFSRKARAQFRCRGCGFYW